jgi:hypothetical protein
LINEGIDKEDIVIIKVYLLNNSIPKYLMHMLSGLKGEIDNSTIIVGDFNTPLSIMGRKNWKDQQRDSKLEHYRPSRPNRHI